jgi:addiction module RelE/StbE family toxin
VIRAIFIFQAHFQREGKRHTYAASGVLHPVPPRRKTRSEARQEHGQVEGYSVHYYSGSASAAKVQRPSAQKQLVGYRDAHIEPDWLLIYCIQEEAIRFERTGTHADLFD